MVPGQGEVLEYRLGLPRGGQRVPVQSLLCHVQVQLHLKENNSVICILKLSGQRESTRLLHCDIQVQFNLKENFIPLDAS
jgi:hypothetical protein